MKYFMAREHVNQYKEMVKDYDAYWIVEKLSQFLPEGKSLLELGMGPGMDLEVLSKKYMVVGSDNSPLFVDDFKAKASDIPVKVVDAITMNIQQNFDCIYSNKVLQHLSRSQFALSLTNQKEHLNPDGIIFMTLWSGEDREELMFEGELRFTYYSEPYLRKCVEESFHIVHLEHYTEMDKDDSILLVLKAK